MPVKKCSSAMTGRSCHSGRPARRLPCRAWTHDFDTSASSGGPLIGPDELAADARQRHRARRALPAWAARPVASCTRPATCPARRTSTSTPTSPPRPATGGRHPLPDRGRLRGGDASCRGAAASRPVVVYDDWQGRAAARAWWLLRHHGHRDVRVLDGGWTAWLAAGHAVETGEVRPEPGDFTVAADAADARRRRGRRARRRRAGRRPGARALRGRDRAGGPGGRPHPGRGQRADDGEPRRARSLPARRRSCGRRTPRVGADGSRTVAAYCGSGVTAAHDVLAMEVAGIRAALYPGSWSGWITDPARPVERGADQEAVTSSPTLMRPRRHGDEVHGEQASCRRPGGVAPACASAPWRS